MSSLADELKLLLQLAADARITSYVAAASLALAIFEWFISLGREVELVWTRRKSLVKWLYIWVRYFVDILPSWNLIKKTQTESIFLVGHDLPLHVRCFIFQQVQGTSATIIIGTVDFILLLRIWILCGRSHRISYVLLGLIIAEITAMLCITTLTVNHLTEFVHFGFITGCYSPDVPKYFAAYPVPSLIVSLSMFCITTRICLRRLAVSRRFNTQSILIVFLRDGIVWFLVITLINPPQIGLWGWGRPTLG
ncbi:hypothetical protein C8F04DRAFT_1319436 [Mycena alexandri]|uniref:DUF6533 domain-containing protein n=1 Tax=Mycena alexandri TaxID=1745969 RepID=A0AAD6S6K3_9AGAR|nr:hypothetical protein C8F04DRAFT_1319436 [Mycena alexandri]